MHISSIHALLGRKVFTPMLVEKRVCHVAEKKKFNLIRAGGAGHR